VRLGPGIGYQIAKYQRRCDLKVRIDDKLTTMLGKVMPQQGYPDYWGFAVVVERGTSPKIYSESALMHKVKLELRSQGYDVIKKLMWKDGHMVDESQHYIRERNYAWAIYDPEWVIRRTYEDYNAANRNLVLSWVSLVATEMADTVQAI
tara:strand:+ start:297 stop:743 length:447 start_codon:yes stop_codon:yes gene_type:complete